LRSGGFSGKIAVTRLIYAIADVDLIEGNFLGRRCVIDFSLSVQGAPPVGRHPSTALGEARFVIPAKAGIQRDAMRRRKACSWRE
jgi:hypothetical protein